MWAANGTNLSDPFTDNPQGELSWGSAPRNLGYTVYDGNYLNWKNSPVNVTMSRSDIMKEVTKKVLSSVNNLNVGLMRFNERQGGPVILGITDLDANRQDVHRCDHGPARERLDAIVRDAIRSGTLLAWHAGALR